MVASLVELILSKKTFDIFKAINEIFRHIKQSTLLGGHTKCTSAQDFRVLTPFALVCPCLFSSTNPHPTSRLPSTPQGTFVLARALLSPSISIIVKFREKKSVMSTSIFCWIQRVFYEATVESLWIGHHWCMGKVSALWRCPPHEESI